MMLMFSILPLSIQRISLELLRRLIEIISIMFSSSMLSIFSMEGIMFILVIFSLHMGLMPLLMIYIWDTCPIKSTPRFNYSAFFYRGVVMLNRFIPVLAVGSMMRPVIKMACVPRC